MLNLQDKQGNPIIPGALFLLFIYVNLIKKNVKLHERTSDLQETKFYRGKNLFFFL